MELVGDLDLDRMLADAAHHPLHLAQRRRARLLQQQRTDVRRGGEREIGHLGVERLAHQQVGAQREQLVERGEAPQAGLRREPRGQLVGRLVEPQQLHVLARPQLRDAHEDMRMPDPRDGGGQPHQ